MHYDDRYTDDSHGMAEPASLLPPKAEPKITIQRMTEGHIEVEHPYPDVAAAIEAEDNSSSERASQEAFLKMVADAESEMPVFIMWAAYVLTTMSARAVESEPVREALNSTLAIAPVGFLTVANRIFACDAGMHEILSEFRTERLARHAANSIAGLSS